MIDVQRPSFLFGRKSEQSLVTENNKEKSTEIIRELMLTIPTDL